MGVTTVYINRWVVQMIGWVIDTNFGKRKNIEEGRLGSCDQTLYRR
jgi:hypothetical protein